MEQSDQDAGCGSYFSFVNNEILQVGISIILHL